MSEEMRFEDESQILDAVGKMAKKLAQRYLTWSGPYDASDLTDLWSTVRVKARVRRKKGRLARKRRVEANGLDYKETGHANVAALYSRLAILTRKALGFNDALTLEELEKRLKSIEVEVGTKDSAQVWYPKKDWLSRRRLIKPELHVWSVLPVDIPNPALESRGSMSVSDAVHLVSGWLNCHPAMALAFLLCDLPIHKDVVTVVINPFSYGKYNADAEIAMYVRGPDVPIWVATDMYKFARVILLIIRRRLRGQTPVRTPRPRGITRKVHDLAAFVLETNSLSWQQRFSKWNDEHPEWKYDNVNSMRAVYYRAKAVRTRGKGRNRSSQEPTREGGKVT